MPNPSIVRTKQAAEYLSLSPSTLEKMRVRGDGPAFVRLGARAVGYRLDDLERWAERNVRVSTSQSIGSDQRDA